MSSSTYSFPEGVASTDGGKMSAGSDREHSMVFPESGPRALKTGFENPSVELWDGK